MCWFYWGAMTRDKTVNHSCLHLSFLLPRCVAILYFTKYSGLLQYKNELLFLRDDWRFHPSPKGLTCRTILQPFSSYAALLCICFPVIFLFLFSPWTSYLLLRSLQSSSQTFQAQRQILCTKGCKFLGQELSHYFCELTSYVPLIGEESATYYMVLNNHYTHKLFVAAIIRLHQKAVGKITYSRGLSQSSVPSGAPSG